MTQATPTPELPKTMTVAQAASVFQRHRRWIVYLIETGQLNAVLHKDGTPGRGIYRIDADELYTVMRLHQHGQGRWPLSPEDLN